MTSAPAPVQTLHLAKTVLMTFTEYFRHHEISPDPTTAALDLMRAHASCTLLMPTMQMIETLASQRAIVSSIARDPSPENAKRTAALHDVKQRQVTAIVKKTGLSIAARREIARRDMGGT